MSGETRAELMDGEGGPAAYWLDQISRRKKAWKGWHDNGKMVVKRYRDERDAVNKDQTRFNILWSNTETLKAALLARTAKADVRRRWADRDPLGREIAIVTERAIDYEVECERWQESFEAALDDHLLPGRGVVWIVYKPELVEVDEVVIGEDGALTTTKVERIAGQKFGLDHVLWEDYLEGPARCWKDVPWIARRHLYTKDKLLTDFAEKGNKVNLTWEQEDEKDKELDDANKRAVVWEIWSKDDKTRIYVAEGCDEILEQTDDPYHLEDFWPIPKPLDAVMTNDSRIPVPEYEIYQDQAEELDAVSQRIAVLTAAARRRGVYDSAVKELARLANAGDNVLIPSENFANFAQKGGFAGTVQWEDISGIITALSELYRQRAQLVQTIYEVTGISDVVRGATDPRETATAQHLKGQFGSMRLKRRQDAVQRWVRDAYRLLAEMLCEHVEPEILSKMTGKEVTPEMIQVMRDDRLRSYKIDIETDSTVFEDAETEKQTRVEFLTAAGGFMQQAVQATQAVPQLGKLAFEMLAFGVRAFKVGRGLEDVIDQTGAAIEQAAQQPKQQASPEMIKMQAEQAKAQAAASTAERKLAADVQMKQAAMQQDAALEMRRMQTDAELRREEIAADGVVEAAKLAQERQFHADDMALRNRQLNRQQPDVQ